MLRGVAVSVLLAGTAASGLAGEGRPPLPEWSTAPEGCVWRWTEGGGIGLWTESCVFGTGRWEVAWSVAQAAFVQFVDDTPLGVLVQPVALAAGGGIEAVPERLVASGQLAPDMDCVFRQVPLRPTAPGVTLHVLAPADGKIPAVTEAGDIPEPPCGLWGASTHGVRYAITDARWPELVVLVEEGQERPMFEPRSITRLP